MKKIARTIYAKQMQQKVPGFAVFDAGIYVHPKFPFLGVTPDGIHHQTVNMDCWRSSVLFQNE